MVRPILFIDFGNTATKYMHKSQVGYFGTAREFLRYVEDNDVTEVLFSSVTPRSIEFTELAEAKKIRVVEAKVVDGFEGLFLSYSDVTTFGIDRWLSIIAARREFPRTNLCLVSVGTALTIDCLNMTGAHLGGAIAPGLKSSAKVLNTSTGKLPEVNLQFKGMLGADTASSINFGLFMSAVGLIDHAISKMGKQHVKLVLTGGDAELLKPWLTEQAYSLPNSVLKGLVTYSTFYDR